MSNLIKKKLTKKIWWDDELWNLKEIISPTKYDDYLLLERKLTKTHVRMALIDAHNEAFYPDNDKVKKMIKNKLEMEEKIEKLEYNYDGDNNETLNDEWLNCFKKKV